MRTALAATALFATASAFAPVSVHHPRGASVAASAQTAALQMPSLAPQQIAQRQAIRHMQRARRVSMEAFSFDPFDRDVFRILMDAQSEARVLGAPAVGTQHLLLAATMQKDDVQAALEGSGVETERLRTLLRGGKGGNMPGIDRLFAATAKDELLPFAKDTERALKNSVSDSRNGGALARDELISWRELMLSVLAGDASDTSAVKAIEDLGLQKDAVYDAVEKGERELVGAGGSGARRNSTLSKCSVDLTQKARDGLLDPLVGREDEVARAMQILVRRRKNNPVLIGDPGAPPKHVPAPLRGVLCTRVAFFCAAAPLARLHVSLFGMARPPLCSAPRPSSA